ncbi:MAG: nitroreductase family protein [Betaproteobacteria bacterium]|nr:nitroreductase family protein [Betaproteobacteria bacterium]MBU6511749.1 nitroreductase family protein [Betaproteobacteria bacterium]MDE1954242.1 nitroreductase family protein [Betaproteobacteria bacterium]MDE2153303.1 nitroreductase family protein [Betaproteobacteria bacterium]
MSLPTSWIDLGNPRPLEVAKSYVPIVWPGGDVVRLPERYRSIGDPRPSSCEPTLREVFARRRSLRTFGSLRREALSAVLEMTCRTQRTATGSGGAMVSQRPVPSAGAIHPVHLLVLEPDAPALARYDSIGHALVSVPSKIDTEAVRTAIAEVLDPQAGTILILAAEPNCTASNYESSTSLVWRDAGVLLGALALAAESLGLAHCPLGVTGEPFVSELLDQAALKGVGVLLLGSRLE